RGAQSHRPGASTGAHGRSHPQGLLGRAGGYPAGPGAALAGTRATIRGGQRRGAHAAIHRRHGAGLRPGSGARRRRWRGRRAHAAGSRHPAGRRAGAGPGAGARRRRPAARRPGAALAAGAHAAAVLRRGLAAGHALPLATPLDHHIWNRPPMTALADIEILLYTLSRVFLVPVMLLIAAALAYALAMLGAFAVE